MFCYVATGGHETLHLAAAMSPPSTPPGYVATSWQALTLWAQSPCSAMSLLAGQLIITPQLRHPRPAKSLLAGSPVAPGLRCGFSPATTAISHAQLFRY